MDIVVVGLAGVLEQWRGIRKEYRSGALLYSCSAESADGHQRNQCVAASSHCSTTCKECGSASLARMCYSDCDSDA